MSFALKYWKFLAGGLVVLVIGIALALHMRSDGKTREELAGYRKQAGAVVEALKIASNNPKADWQTAPGQIIALGESNRTLKVEITDTNQRIDEMAEEAVRLRKRADELRAIAAKAEAQRRAAYVRLSDMAITPGERGDCMALLREAEEALNVVREAGL